MWSADGREVFFLKGRRYDWKQILAASVSTDPVLAIGRPRVVHELEDVRDLVRAPNGDFLLLQRAPGSGIQTRVHLVQNWFQELERLVP